MRRDGELEAEVDVVELTERLVAVDSTSGREGNVMALVETVLGAQGWRVRRIPVSTGRDDILATWTDADAITLSTHLDTVPPHIPPRIAGDVIHGRGSCDAKGIGAAMICAAQRLRGRGVPVALLFVVGEETAHDGARAADDWAAGGNIVSRALVNGEPTERTLAVGTKGAMRFTLRTAGRAAHSAYPELGVSATHALVTLLAELNGLALPHDAELGATTINIGFLSGGIADNVLAPSAEARLMARLVTPSSEVSGMLRRWVAGRAELEIGATVPAVHLPTLPGFATSVVAFATDIPALSHWGTPYLFGPGSIHSAHTDGESVRVEELRAAVGDYERIVEGILRSPAPRVIPAV
ncbi:MAG: succinyl-diaminopimelate desuccinylase [Gemmatimonadaceae bacterium]